MMKKERTRCETARNFPIEKALEKLGHFPTRTSEKEAWFLSPFRSETQASFKVSLDKNRWYDHGAGIGGNVIDLICMLSKGTVREALDLIQKGQTSFSFQQQPSFEKEKDSGIKIGYVRPIGHYGLIKYLFERKISISTASLLCREVHYALNGRHYFAIGLPNNSGGWELRNKYFKSSASPKDLTHIKNGNDKLIITEGMFDMLSIMEINKGLQGEYDFLVLNSTAFVNGAMGYLEGYVQIELYLDNDDSGKQTAKTLMENNEGCIDRSSLYKGFKDMSEWFGSGRTNIL